MGCSCSFLFWVSSVKVAPGCRIPTIDSLYQVVVCLTCPFKKRAQLLEHLSAFCRLMQFLTQSPNVSGHHGRRHGQTSGRSPRVFVPLKMLKNMSECVGKGGATEIWGALEDFWLDQHGCFFVRPHDHLKEDSGCWMDDLHVGASQEHLLMWLACGTQGFVDWAAVRREGVVKHLGQAP